MKRLITHSAHGWRNAMVSVHIAIDWSGVEERSPEKASLGRETGKDCTSSRDSYSPGFYLYWHC